MTIIIIILTIIIILIIIIIITAGATNTSSGMPGSIYKSLTLELHCQPGGTSDH